MNMGVLKLNELPVFDMPDIYKKDVWDIQNMDIFKNSTKKQQENWKKRSNVTNYYIDFRLCKNTVIREELKYVFYDILSNSKATISGYGEYYDYFKILCKYINDKAMNKKSVLDISNTDFCFYLENTLNIRTKCKDGTIINKDMEKVDWYRPSRKMTFLGRCQQIIKDYNEKDIPEYEKDYWKLKNMGFVEIEENKNNIRNLDFRNIKQSSMKAILKKYCYLNLSAITTSSVSRKLGAIKEFCDFLHNEYPDIEYFNQVDREIIENYYLFLRIESNHSDHHRNFLICELHAFIDTGILEGYENFFTYNPTFTNDWAFKKKKQSKFFTDEEMKNIISVIPKLPPIYGQIIYTLIITGCRISEILFLEPSMLITDSSGAYMLKIFQTKTKKEYIKPIPTALANVLQKEIQQNRKKFNCEPKYIFLDDNNTPYSYHVVMTQVNKYFYELDVLDKDNERLRFKSHRFRATLATNLISSGNDASTVGKLLGQNQLDSLTYYATIKDKVAQEQLAPRLNKVNALIKNIGHIKDYKEEEITGIPLCNGYCSMNSQMGICSKANACLTCSMFVPSPQFLNHYILQLQETEATIKIAEANDMDLLLSKSLVTKEALENIISKVKQMEDNHNE